VDDNNCNTPNLELRTNSKLAIIEFTIKEMSDILKSLNIKNASGHDWISRHMLKKTQPILEHPGPRPDKYLHYSLLPKK
jgi:hypothetical protein